MFELGAKAGFVLPLIWLRGEGIFMDENKNVETKDVNELVKIRKDKLAQMQKSGNDPLKSLLLIEIYYQER